MSLYSRLDRLAADVEKLDRKVDSVSNSPQAQRTSIEAGTMDINDEDGNLVSTIGFQNDGSGATRFFDGPTPPIPAGFTALADGPLIQGTWDGTFEGGAQATYDLAYLEVAATVVDDDNRVSFATITAKEGASATVVANQTGMWVVAVRSVSQAGKKSEFFSAGTVEVKVTDLSGAIEAVQDSANGKNKITWSLRIPTVDDIGTIGDTWWVNEARSREDGEPYLAIIAQYQYQADGWVQVEMAHEVIASVDLGTATVGELDGIRIMAQSMSSDVFTGQAFSGYVFTGSIFRTTNGSEFSDSGLFMYDQDGTPRIQAPTDGSDFTVNAEIVAKSLTASGRASFLAENNRLEPGAGLVLAAGVGDPPSPPVVSNYYPTITPPPLAEGESVAGLAYGDGLFWRAVDAGAGNNQLDRIEGIDRAGSVQRTIPLVNFWALNGLTAIGDELFALGIRDDRPESMRKQERWVRVYGLDGTYKRQWEYPNYGTGAYQPGIGRTDVGNVVIAHCWQDGRLSWRVFSPTGSLISTTTREAPVKSGCAGVYSGPGDFGTNRVVFAKASTQGTDRQFTTYGTNGNDYFPEQSWYAPGRASSVGLAWDGQKFYSINDGGVITEYVALNMGDDSANWWATYRWVGSGGKTTRIAPPARFAWARRSRLRVSAPNLPQGVTTIEPSLTFKTTTPVRTEFRSPAWVAGAAPATVNYEVLPTNWQSGAAPGDINNFPNSTPSIIKAASGLWGFRGDGTAWLGPLTFNADGTMSSSEVPTWAPITAFASGFKAGSFGFAPAYRVWPDGKVEWRGTVEGNVTAFSHDAFTIPSAALPTQAVQGRVATSAGTGGTPALTRCEFRPEGATTKFRVYQGGTNRSWFSLDQNWYYKS